MNKLDSNGQELKILFQGNDSYTTKLGGAISLIVYTIVIAYGSQKILQLVTNGDPTITSEQKFVAASQTPPVSLDKNDFDIITSPWY